ncbi:hypothetical protein [Prosthecomicrobium sp. N25]|uniref:hypothetical protein n=1 Tax=Prosthecomicrobium sp. N25 TaxID=3129254 RepID=UPI0030769441
MTLTFPSGWTAERAAPLFQLALRVGLAALEVGDAVGAGALGPIGYAEMAVVGLLLVGFGTRHFAVLYLALLVIQFGMGAGPALDAVLGRFAAGLLLVRFGGGGITLERLVPSRKPTPRSSRA